jgi:hypothetical protein
MAGCWALRGKAHPKDPSVGSKKGAARSFVLKMKTDANPGAHTHVDAEARTRRGARGDYASCA